MSMLLTLLCASFGAAAAAQTRGEPWTPRCCHGRLRVVLTPSHRLWTPRCCAARLNVEPPYEQAAAAAVSRSPRRLKTDEEEVLLSDYLKLGPEAQDVEFKKYEAKNKDTWAKHRKDAAEAERKAKDFGKLTKKQKEAAKRAKKALAQALQDPPDAEGVAEALAAGADVNDFVRTHPIATTAGPRLDFAGAFLRD